MADGEGESVKVAVKVRPFNQREIDNNCKLIVEMDGPTTILHHESGDESLKKSFTFDYSYWSFKPSFDSSPVDSHYTNNTQVFQDIGKGVLFNAWAGYNTSLFAYGQTGSGKSHSMLGVADDPGIIPLVSQDIFTQISSKSLESSDEFESPPEYIVEASMFEIYNERIQDLLSGKKDELDVREDPKTGPYVQGLSKHVCRRYAEIRKLNEDGDKARTTGATKMNAKSSRAHTIFQIRFEQKTHRKGSKPTIKVSTICLVDLAGAEKQKSTEATGDRAKEGIKINLSLTNLGLCISALAENCSNKKKKVVVPFRSSKLTFILKNMLGGNSKTIMIAAISPASINFNETLSTLEYASRTKKIKTVAKVNEDENEKLIRQLKGQVSDLENQLRLARQGIDPSKMQPNSDTEKELQELRAQLSQSKSVIQELQMTTEERAERTKELQETRIQALMKAGIVQDETFDRKRDIHLVNLNEDAFMSEQLLYPIKQGVTSVGSKLGSAIYLEGLGIEENHCAIEVTQEEEKMKIVLTPSSGETFVNGGKVKSTVTLKHGDRIILGSSYVFKLVNPIDARTKPSGQREVIDWMFAQKELMQAQFNVTSGPSEQEISLQSKLKEMEMQQKERENQIIKEKKQMEEAAEQLKKKLQEEQLELKKILESTKQKDNTTAEEIRKIQEQQKLAQIQLEKQKEDLEEKQRTMQHQIEEEKRKIKANVEQQMEIERKRSMLEENLARLIPVVNEANLISKKLCKNKKFELKILHEQGIDNEERSNVGVVVSDFNGVVTTWNMDEITNRRYVMQEVYQEYLKTVENGTSFSIETLITNGVIDYDPFEDPEAWEKYNLLGTSRVFLKTLAHNIEFGSYTPILDFQGQRVGDIRVGITPLDQDGRSEKEGADIEIFSDPLERAGNPVNFAIHIDDIVGLPKNNCRDVLIRYKFYLESQDTEVSCQGESSSQIFSFRREYFFQVATKDFLNYLMNKMLVIYVYSKRVLNEQQKKQFFENEEKRKVNVDELLERIRILEVERDHVVSDLALMRQENRFSKEIIQQLEYQIERENSKVLSHNDNVPETKKRNYDETEGFIQTSEEMKREIDQKNLALQGYELQLQEERRMINQERGEMKSQLTASVGQEHVPEMNTCLTLEDKLSKKEDEIRILKLQIKKFDCEVKRQREELIKTELFLKDTVTKLKPLDQSSTESSDKARSRTCSIQ